MRRADQIHLLFRTEPEPSPLSARHAGEVDLTDQPAVALLHAVAGAAVELLGPMFWAALIVLFIRVELRAG
jgi:hypothetical protein